MFLTSQVLDLMEDNRQLRSRVEVLTSALTEALDELDRLRALLVYHAQEHPEAA